MFSASLANHPKPCVMGTQYRYTLSVRCYGVWGGHTRRTQVLSRISQSRGDEKAVPLGPRPAQLELHIEKQTRSPGSSLVVRSQAHLISLGLRPSPPTFSHRVGPGAVPTSLSLGHTCNASATLLISCLWKTPLHSLFLVPHPLKRHHLSCG